LILEARAGYIGQVLFWNKEYYEESVRGTYRKKRKDFPVQYNLTIIDEFQNYLPEQLSLLNIVNLINCASSSQ